LNFLAEENRKSICCWQEEKGPKNYSWRKEMEAYEENLDKINTHKKIVHDSTKTTRL
jgi:hypothetical protein